MRKLLLIAALAAACTSTESVSGPSGTYAVMDLGADLAQPASFYDFPYPSDLRLDASGAPDLRGFPGAAAVPMVADLQMRAGLRKAFPVLPVAYFRFTAPLAARDPAAVIPAAPASPVLIVDVDPASDTPGALVPAVAAALAADEYTAENVLAVAPVPGFVLRGGRLYAVVVLRSLGDAAGKRLGRSATLAALAAGRSPGGAKGAAAKALYAPLWATLAVLGVARDEVAAATVFTTADVVQELFDLSEAVAKKYAPALTGVHIEADDGAAHPTYCELEAQISYPQFQRGTPPFNKDAAGAGLFDVGADGLPAKQRDETALVSLAIPKTPMPAAGYPLTVYIHGSGGLHNQVIDRGRALSADGPEAKGEGPAFVLAAHGIAAAGSAMPVNPERAPGGDPYAYLNLDNVAAFTDTFRQGALEQRLFLSALLALRVDKAAVLGAACTEVTLPAGVTQIRFDPAKLAVMGQSMGGMYTNLVASIEPRFTAAVPTGAGGYWSYFILETGLIPGADKLLALLLKTNVKLSFMHPAMHMLQTAWEPAEPLVYMPRVGARPLAGHPARSIYEPVGKGDSYFPTTIYDAVALAYGHPQAGDAVWPSMQDALALAGLDGLLPYPVVGNLTSATGARYTGVVVQYAGDGYYDPHSIFSQLDDVKYQYGCFLETFFATGSAKVLAPKPLGTACN
jgi:hypothetical protein